MQGHQNTSHSTAVPEPRRFGNLAQSQRFGNQPPPHTRSCLHRWVTKPPGSSRVSPLPVIAMDWPDCQETRQAVAVSKKVSLAQLVASNFFQKRCPQDYDERQGWLPAPACHKQRFVGTTCFRFQKTRAAFTNSSRRQSCPCLHGPGDQAPSRTFLSSQMARSPLRAQSYEGTQTSTVATSRREEGRSRGKGMLLLTAVRRAAC